MASIKFLQVFSDGSGAAATMVADRIVWVVEWRCGRIQATLLTTGFIGRRAREISKNKCVATYRREVEPTLTAEWRALNMAMYGQEAA